MYFSIFRRKKLQELLQKQILRNQNNNEKSSEQSSSSDLGPEGDEEIKLDFVSIEKELLQEQSNGTYQDSDAFILHTTNILEERFGSIFKD